MSKKTIGEVIASLRAGIDLSQEELADRAGLHRTYVSQLERSLKSPTLETLQKIATAFNLKASALIKLTEDDIS